MSKIFSLIESNCEDIKDENLKNFINASEGLKDCLLNFANYKPKKKNMGENKKNNDFENFQDETFKKVLEKIIKFK